MNLEPIFEAVRRAAVLCRAVQQRFLTGTAKDDASPVTIADYGSQALIGEAVGRAFPGDVFLAEESGTQFLRLVPEDQRRQVVRLISSALGREVSEGEVVGWLDCNPARDAGHANAGRTWVVDPIDGTKGFLARRQYAIAVGILERGVLQGGVMGCPAYSGHDGGVLLHAWGGEAYLRGLAGGQPRPIHVSGRVDAGGVRVLESVEKAHAAQDRMGRVRELAGLADSPFERIDSQEKYARIAAGDADLYLRLPRPGVPSRHNSWDHAAGAALVIAAGGSVTDIDGSPLDFTHGRVLARNRGMIVSNGYIHPRVLAAVAALLREEGDV